jgi:predicted transcriptional regulator
MTSVDLDLFVLALVQSGMATTYDLKSQAGLSVGSTSPILARLEKAGLVEAPKAERSRGARRFSITTAGRKHLSAGWKQLVERRPTDTDEILRITYIAWVMGFPEIAATFVENSAAGLNHLAATRQAEVNQLRGTLGGQVGGQAFRWLRAGADAARLQAQAAALTQLGRQIKQIKTKTK